MLVLAIFGFAFLFRAAVIFHNEYPPSSDIGFHGSILNLILDEGKLPLWNPYHMGGEPLSTPPGFHFFVSVMILLTGMPIIVAELITAALYSAFIVFPAYLISKKIWKNEYAGILAAFFAAISALSLEMISWGGYTNIVSIALMILLFYLFIRDIEQPRYTNLLMGMLLFGSLTITHTFTLSVVLPILAVFYILLIVGKVLKLEEVKISRSLRFLAVSFALGALVVSPWILRVLNFYIDASTQGVLLGGLETNKNLILENRSLDPIILGLLVALVPAFFMFKSSRKRLFDTETLLVAAWFIVPVVLTQAYIFGLYVDYSRFMYFIDFPGILIISAGLCYLFHYTTVASNKFPKIKWVKTKKWVLPTLFTSYIFIFIVLSPWSIFPNEAMDRANFYTTIQKPEAKGIEWIQNNTAESSVLVADHLYGWWLSGLARSSASSPS